MSEENNSFNVESLGEALNNENLRGQILESIANNEYGQTYLNNFAKTHWDKNIGTEVGTIHGKYDQDLKDLGFNKPDGVKTYEFVKSTIKDLQEKALAGDPAAIEALRTENTDLKSKLENNEAAKHFKDLYESTKNTSATKIEELENQISSFRDKQRRFTIETELNRVLTGLDLNDSLPEDVRKTYVDTVYKSLLDNAKVLEDGSIAFYNGEELIVNKKNMEKASASYILKDRLKSIIAEKQDTTGSGGQDESMSGKKRSNVTFANAKTKVELTGLIEQSLLADGFTKGSSEFATKSNEIFVESGGNNLPLK